MDTVSQEVIREIFDVGVILFEPFGGLCAGLEAALRNGLRIARYFYVDKNPMTQKVAKYRVEQLLDLYPSQLSKAATEEMMILERDVTQLVKPPYSVQLRELVKWTRNPWLIVAGWECQDLSPASPAGSGKGLKGRRSGTFFPLLHLIAQVQSAHPLGAGRVAHLLENVAMQFNWKHLGPSTQDSNFICSILGQPIVCDAAAFGSRAHRLRNFLDQPGASV